MKSNVMFLSFILLLFIIGVSFKFFQNIKKTDRDSRIITVNLKGAVRKEGIYYIRYGATIGELLEKCGGITDLGYLQEGFDYNTPITEDTAITIPKKYTLKKNFYEEK